MKDISNKQIGILQFIINCKKADGYPPTIREIAKAVNLSSSATVYGHLKKLEKLGYVRRDPSKPRAIEILPRSKSFISVEKAQKDLNSVMIPVVGSIAAGKPILAEENIEDYFPLTSDFLRGGNQVFLLKVRGDSMINAGIMDRDYIVVRKQETAINGEIVVVLMENEATVKRFFKQSKNIRLVPENDHMEPLIVKDASIIGKVIGLIRKYF